MSKRYISLGLMSGTSGDGVDASIINSNGTDDYESIKDRYFEYDKQLIQKINKYDERVFKKDPIPENKQRHVDLYGFAKKGTWSENISRQLSVPERSNFKKWLNENGFNLE